MPHTSINVISYKNQFEIAALYMHYVDKTQLIISKMLNCKSLRQVYQSLHASHCTMRSSGLYGISHLQYLKT